MNERQAAYLDGIAQVMTYLAETEDDRPTADAGAGSETAEMIEAVRLRNAAEQRAEAAGARLSVAHNLLDIIADQLDGAGVTGVDEDGGARRLTDRVQGLIDHAAQLSEGVVASRAEVVALKAALTEGSDVEHVEVLCRIAAATRSKVIAEWLDNMESTVDAGLVRNGEPQRWYAFAKAS